MSKISYGLALANLVGCGLAAWPQDADVDSFITTERGIALTGALANIGPNGAAVPGAGPGIVVASPSKKDPDCKFTISCLRRHTRTSTRTDMAYRLLHLVP